MTSRRLRALVIALAAPALVAQAALAQTRAQPRAPQRKPHSAPASAPPKKTVAEPDAGAPLAPAPSSAPAPVAAASSGDAGVVEAKTLDGGTHVFKFSELDIEGRLKSPQLVYFLRRVRAEFAAGDLGHRPFLREMAETRKERTF